MSPSRRLLEVRVRWLAARADLERVAGRYAGAEKLLRSALSLVRRDRPGTLLELSLLNRLGMVHKYQGRFREGAAAYLAAMRIVRRGAGVTAESRRGLLASLYHNLGGLEHARGRHRRGEPFARRAVELRVAELGAEHVDVARDRAAHAALMDGLGRHEEAEPLHRRAIEVLEARAGDRAELACAVANLSSCLHSLGRTQEAMPFARRALALQESSLGREHPDVGLTLLNLAVLRRALGDCRGAEADCERARALLEARLAPEHPALAACREQLAELRPPAPPPSM